MQWCPRRIHGSGLTGAQVAATLGSSIGGPQDAASRAVSGLILAAWLALGAAAQGPEPGPEPADAPATPDPVELYRVELEQAKALWFQGEGDLAHERLERLFARAVAGEAVPLALSGECAIYLGEIEMDRGLKSKADTAFTWLLQQDPNFPISPYHHPIDVVGQFEVVRKQVRDALPPVVRLPPPRYPAWGYAPFGVPQLRQGKRVRGAIYLGAQATLAVASVGLWVDMAIANPPPGDWTGNPYGWGEDGATDRLLDRKFRLQWPATFGFYGLWVISVLDGQSTFRAAHAGDAGVARMPLPVGVSGRW
jgi:hypothetical protein